MICPRCGHENIAGDDRCENCLEPFRDRDVPHAREGLQRILMEQHVSAIATTALVAVKPEATVAEALREMKSHGVGCVLVVSEGMLAGIFTERDLLDVVSEARDLDAVPVTQVMTGHPEAVESSDSLRFALHKMSVGGFRHIPITEAGRAVGIVSAKDVVRLLAKEVPAGN
ncbi:MAG TPA: CBS domain-containing protein [Blastocatellia bacterium]|nr:CBS domain-containing protein [Blastocatellia bacterium]